MKKLKNTFGELETNVSGKGREWTMCCRFYLYRRRKVTFLERPIKSAVIGK